MDGAQTMAEAIATDLAPASAIALLAKAETAENALDAVPKPIAAGVSDADDETKLRVQLMFPDGSLLPIELDREAGHALVSGLTAALSEPPASSTEPGPFLPRQARERHRPKRPLRGSTPNAKFWSATKVRPPARVYCFIASITGCR